MGQVKLADFWAINCRTQLLGWVGEDGSKIASQLSKNRAQLDQYKQELIHSNDALASANPLDVAEDLDFYKNVVIVYFLNAVAAAMNRDRSSFTDASKGIFDYFSDLDNEEKTKVINNAFSFYSQIKSEVLRDINILENSVEPIQ